MIFVICALFVALIPVFLLPNSWKPVLVLTLGIGGVSLGLYALWGDARGLAHQQAYEGIQAALVDMQQEDTLTRDIVVNKLDHLQSTLPKHPVLWQRLGDIYFELLGPEQSIEAYRTALDLEPKNKELIHRLLYVSSLMHQGELPDEDLKLVTILLDSNPNDLPALNLLAMSAYKKGNYQIAIDFWEEILQLTEHDAEFERATLRKVIAKAKQDMGHPPQLENEKQKGVALTLHVSLSKDLNLDVPGNTPVFVFIKQSSGGGMPLAVKRLSFSDLPCTITLDASDAMTQDNSLKVNQQVIAGARVAISQQAIPEAGDWQGYSENLLVTGKHELDLIIKEMI